VFESRKTKEQTKRDKKIAKLKLLLGVDFCACGTMYADRCDGICRVSHTNEKGAVQCYELYQVDPALVRPKRGKHKKRTQLTKNDGKRKNDRRDRKDHNYEKEE